MSLVYYSIAGINICIETQQNEKFERFADFEAKPFSCPDLFITLKKEPVDITGYEVIFKDTSVVWYKRNEEYACVFYTENWKKALVGFFFNEKCDRATVFYQGLDPGYYITGPVGEIVFRNALIQRGGMVIHASAINYKENGIFFSAQAGTGKTTHSMLWVDYAGASILNGDRPPIMVTDSGVFLCGSPWSGSSPDFENKILPLKAMVFLERAAENKIEKLSGGSVLIHMAPRCFLPYYSKKAMALAMDNIEKIIKNTNGYILKCRPDKEAMGKVLECVKPILKNI